MRKQKIAINDILTLAHEAQYRALTRSLKVAGQTITVEQWSLLKHLYHNAGYTQQQVAACSNKDKPSVCRLIDNMQKQKWVVRTPDKTDKRINRIHLTDKGRKLYEQLSDAMLQQQQQVVKGISVADLKHCNETLQKMIDNLA